jgi:ubiquinone/menaquinone biosynthesis C-methylase UbiE
MDDPKRAAQRWFDRRAGSYQGGWTARWRDPLQRASLDALELRGTDRLLDVGCGTGSASRAAAEQGASVVGIDLSSQMIGQASRLAAGRGGVRFALGDAEALPFADGAFTALLCTNAFHHYPRPELAVREMARVLAPGGRLVIGDASADLTSARIADVFLRRFEPGHVRLYRLAELGGFLHAAGPSDVVAKRLSSGGQAIVRGVAA